MNKLDKQFGELMQGVKIETPSPNFTLNVMNRIHAEAAIQQKHLLQDYQPVISRRTWIILIVAFVFFLIYTTLAGQGIDQSNSTGIWSFLTDKLQQLNASGNSNLWNSVSRMFTSVPMITYIILIASLALWTLDAYLNRLRNKITNAHLS
jgi:hypothetical protein